MSASLAKRYPLCNFLAPTVSLWLGHIRSVHSDGSGFLIECCSTQYTKCASFVSHMYRKHRNELGAQTATISANCVQTFSQPEGIPANSADSVSRSLVRP